MTETGQNTEKQQDINVPVIAVIGVVLVVITIAAIIFLQSLTFYFSDQEYMTKFGARPPMDLSNARADQLERMNNYRWVDKEQGKAAIPIDLAMRLTLKELSGGEVENETE